jgi:hypothetical protein
MAKTGTTRVKFRNQRPIRKVKNKAISRGSQSSGGLKKRRAKLDKLEKVVFIYANLSEYIDYHDYFTQLARKLGDDYTPVGGEIPMRGGGAYLSDCDLPKKVVKQFRAEFESYYSMLTQRHKDRMRPYIMKAISNARHILDSDPNLDPLTVVLEGERLLKAGMSADDYQTFRRVLDHPDTRAWLNTLL